MEADEYFRAYDALEKDQRKSRIDLKIGDTCGITQIIWSTFDYMSGPELRFVWDVTPSNESLTPIDLSGDEEPSGSGADDESLDSSMTNSSIQFEEIDDVLEMDLSILDEGMTGDTSISRFLDAFMTESRTSDQSGTRTIDALTDSFASSANIGLPLDESTDSFDSLKTALKGEQPLATSSPHDLTLKERSSDDLGALDTTFPSSSSQFLLPYSSPVMQEQGEDNTDLLTSGYVGSEMMESHEDLPFSPYSILSPEGRPDSDPTLIHRSFMRLSPSSSCSSLLMGDEVTLDVHDDLPDEEFIAKFVLAEQICSTQLSSNPLVHKMMMVPSRRLAVSSFLFGGKEASPLKKGTMHAVSFLMGYKRYKWYMDRHDSIEGFVADLVPKMKASIISEDTDDTVVRLTTEWRRLLSVMGALDRFPLMPARSGYKIKRTFFSTPSLSPSIGPLLSKSISACLQSQGNVVVVGSELAVVKKLMHTLLLFVPPSLRWKALRPYAHEYSPLIGITAVKRSALPTVLHNAVHSLWPVSIIDIDRGLVLISPPFPKHGVNKSRAELSAINGILGRESKKIRPLELSRVRPLDCVVTLLRRMTLLPVEDSARLGFVDQFNLWLDNTGRALIEYVKDASEPSDKSHASRSSSFSLSATRKALDLTNDGLFQSVLARAELLQPEITHFVYM